MKISFDLDDTLIPSSKGDFPTENRNLIQRILGIEFIRKETRQLFNELKSAGHQVGVYTTSFRSPFKIKFQFLTYGIKTDFIVNQTINAKRLRELNISSSKYPPAYNIDLQIDDLRGVGMEGDKFGFETVIISKTSSNWTEVIKGRVLR